MVRAMFFSKDLSDKKDIQKDVLSFVPDAKMDFYDEVDYLTYCAEIRFYSFIFIDRSSVSEKIAKKVLISAKKNGLNPKLFLFGSGSLSVEGYKYIESPKGIGKIIFTHTKERIKDFVVLDNNKIDSSSLKLKIKGSEVPVDITNQMATKILLFLINNRGEHHTMDSILNGISDEPEYTKTSRGEAAISEIRKFFRKTIGEDSIHSAKKIGYKLAL